MKFRNLDVNNDWTFGRGNSDYAMGDKAIALKIKTRLRSWLNDCFFDLNAGIDWGNRLGAKGNSQILLKADISREILETEGVTSLDELSINVVARKFTATYTVTTINSTQIIDEVFNA